MGFNQRYAQSYFTGTQQAFTSPLNAYNGSKIALNTVTAGSTASTAGLVLACANNDIEWDSLHALVETNLTTSTITATTKWQGSPDGTNWVDIVGLNSAANVTKAAAGTGSLVTTQYFQAFAGINPGIRYLRIAVLVGVATGAAGDNVTCSYFFRRRWATA